MLNSDTSTIAWPETPYTASGLIGTRSVQKGRRDLPLNTVIVSADNHINIAEDIWASRVPERMRPRMPSVWWDERQQHYQFGFKGVPLFPENTSPLWRSMDCIPGMASTHLKARMADLDAEGIAKEVVFPHSLLSLFKWPDYEVRTWLFRSYNQYMAELHAQEPSRFFPVAVGNSWDPKEAVTWIREIAQLGFKSVLFPHDPGNREDGSKINYSSLEYAEMLAAIEESGLVLCFHIGESANIEPGPNGWCTTALIQFQPPFYKALGSLIFGGVFDRFPKLKVMFGEGELHWIAGFLQNAERVYDTHALLADARPKQRPTYYWHKHCFASFMMDPVGMAQLDLIGSNNVMWSADYPHQESTFGFSGSVIDDIVETVSAEDARNILGGTATKLFGLG